MLYMYTKLWLSVNGKHITLALPKNIVFNNFIKIKLQLRSFPKIRSMKLEDRTYSLSQPMPYRFYSYQISSNIKITSGIIIP
jgi:hypothetical protein